MPSPPAHCDNCDLTFEARGAVGLSGSVNYLTIGGTTNCPRCDGRARILDGQYSVRDDVLRLLSAPDWTLERLRQVQAALQQAQQKLESGGDPTAAVAEMMGADPKTAMLLLRHVLASKELGGVGTILTVLLSAVSILVALHTGGEDDVTPEDVQRIVDQQMERHEDTNVPPTPEPPSAPGSPPPAASAPPASSP